MPSAGTTAMQLLGGDVAAPEAPVEGALLHIDLMNAIYWADGEFRAESDLIVGINDQLTIVPGEGVTITSGGGSLPIGGPLFRSVLQQEIFDTGGFSIFIEYTKQTNGSGPWFCIQNDLIEDDADNWWLAEESSQEMNLSSKAFYPKPDPWGVTVGTAANPDPPDIVNPGLNRVGMTFAGSSSESDLFRYAISANGNDMSHSGDPGNEDNVLNMTEMLSSNGDIESGKIYFGHKDDINWWNANAVFRVITLFPAVDDVDIQFISANGVLP